LLDHFSLPTESDDTKGCDEQDGFPAGGFGEVNQYFKADPNGGAKCVITTSNTQYSIYTHDDYKRCVCDTYGDGETDCGSD
jgi:hypothetical protein